MPTKNPRINAALEKPVYSLIEKPAQVAEKREATLAGRRISQTRQKHPDTNQDGH